MRAEATRQGRQVSIRVWFEPRLPVSLREAFATAFEWIDYVHGVSDPNGMQQWLTVGSDTTEMMLGRNCVQVMEDTRIGSMGRYIASRVKIEDDTPGPLMLINPSHDDLAGTVVHECLHLIRREILRKSRGMSGLTAIRFYEMMTFLHRTKSFRRCLAHAGRVRALSNILKDRADLDDEGRKEFEGVLDAAALYQYIASDDEWLARAYSQMIQNRAQRRRNSPCPHAGRMVESLEAWLPMYLSKGEARRGGLIGR